MKKQRTRFLILGYPRTGSNLLLRCLQNHHKVICFNELFNSNEQIIWGYPELNPYRWDARMVAWRNKKPIEFLEQFVWNRSSLSRGFKLFYGYQLSAPYLKHVWGHLYSLNDLHIIHIHRNNYLKMLYSYKLAKKTDQWLHPGKDKEERIHKIYIDHKECENFFVKYSNLKDFYNKMFSRHPILHVCYEEFISNFANTLQNTFDFLNISHIKMQPFTKKQSKPPLKNAIVNYEELKKYFSKSPWSVFFHE